VHQPSGSADQRPYLPRRPGDRFYHQRKRPSAAGDGARPLRAKGRDRHGLPAVQSLAASQRSAKRHGSAAAGPQARSAGGQGNGDGASRAGRHDALCGPLSGAAVGRPATARRDCPCAGHEAQGYAVRRGDLLARSRDDRRGPQHHEGSGQRRHDNDCRHPRDEFRPRSVVPRYILAQGGGAPAEVFENPKSEQFLRFQRGFEQRNAG